MDKVSQVYKQIKNIPTSQAIDMLANEMFYRDPVAKGIRREVMIPGIVKKAGALDPVMDEMCPDVWTADKHPRPEVIATIYKTINSYIPKEAIKQIVILGAITSLQYGTDELDRATADIDVNVVLDPPELVEQLWEIRRAHNEKVVPGTQHAVNIYLQAHTGVIPGYQDSYFGVYDLLAKEWLVSPPPRSSYRDPKDVFWAELVSIKMAVREFMRVADRYSNALNKLSFVNLTMEPTTEKAWIQLKLERLIQKEVTEMVSLLLDLEEGRSFSYGEGWGVPRVGYYNLLYKYFYGYLPEKYAAIFKEIEEIKINQKKQDASISGNQRNVR